MQHAGGMLLIAGLDGDDSLIFAIGENVTSPFGVAHLGGVDAESVRGRHSTVTTSFPVLNLRQQFQIEHILKQFFAEILF